MKRLLTACAVLCLLSLPVSGAKIPRKAPKLTFKLPSGKELSLEQFRGKVIALEFLLTTCPHCKRTEATMQRLYAEFGPKGFQPLGIAFNDNALRDLPAYLQSVRVTYPVGVADRYAVVDFLQHPILLTMWTPQLVIIDKKGIIRYQYAGTDKFFRNEEENLRKLLPVLLSE